MTSPCVYILKCANERFYIGSTNNLLRRFEEHQRGRVKSTKNIRPLTLTFHQKYISLIDARRIELKLKKFKNKKIIQQIIEDGIITMQP